MAQINNNLHLAQKYERIFVRRHYLFKGVNSFPREKLEENCELRVADNVQGQISVHIFLSQMEAIVFIILQKNFSQGLSVGQAVKHQNISFGIFLVCSCNQSVLSIQG